MAFRPVVDQAIKIDGATYRFAEHPSAPGIAYGQTGRAGTVWLLLATDEAPQGDERFSERMALKVFLRRYVDPSMVGLAARLARFANLGGLTVCRRTVLEQRRHGALLRQYPELSYAVCMPWIAGPNWAEIIVARRPLAPSESLAIASALVEVLVRLEQNQIAHCDLSAPNLILTPAKRLRAGSPYGPVELVDVEQLYGPGLDRPRFLPSGSQGYAHRCAAGGLWSADADRFAGAVLIGEMLAWCDPDIRAAADGETYFPPGQMQQPGRHLDLILAVLGAVHGQGLADLFAQAWTSETLGDCPTFLDWEIALSAARDARAAVTAQAAAQSPTVIPPSTAEPPTTAAPTSPDYGGQDLAPARDRDIVTAGPMSGPPTGGDGADRRLPANDEPPAPAETEATAGPGVDQPGETSAPPRSDQNAGIPSGRHGGTPPVSADRAGAAPEQPASTASRNEPPPAAPSGNGAAPAVPQRPGGARPGDTGRKQGSNGQSATPGRPARARAQPAADVDAADNWPCPNPTCLAANPAGTLRCLACGADLVRPCPECGQAASLLATGSCRACGYPYDIAANRAGLAAQLTPAEQAAADLTSRAEALKRKRLHSRLLIGLFVLWLALYVYLLIPEILYTLIFAVAVYIVAYFVRRGRRNRAVAVLAQQAGQAKTVAAELRRAYEALALPDDKRDVHGYIAHPALR